MNGGLNYLTKRKDVWEMVLPDLEIDEVTFRATVRYIGSIEHWENTEEAFSAILSLLDIQVLPGGAILSHFEYPVISVVLEIQYAWNAELFG